MAATDFTKPEQGVECAHSARQRQHGEHSAGAERQSRWACRRCEIHSGCRVLAEARMILRKNPGNRAASPEVDWYMRGFLDGWYSHNGPAPEALGAIHEGESAQRAYEDGYIAGWILRTKNSASARFASADQCA